MKLNANGTVRTLCGNVSRWSTKEENIFFCCKFISIFPASIKKIKFKKVERKCILALVQKYKNAQVVAVFTNCYSIQKPSTCTVPHPH